MTEISFLGGVSLYDINYNAKNSIKNNAYRGSLFKCLKS